MRKYFTVIVTLLVFIYLTESLIVFNINNLPNSKPTDVELFMDEIAEIESGGNHKVVNQYGMMGMYQFSPSTVRGLGFKVTKQEFLKNRHLQDTVMLAYMKTNYRELSSLIEKYNGRTIGGVRINRAAIIAGAHFAGSNGVKSYLISNGQNVVIDGNGTSIKKYMAKFKDFQLPPLTTQEKI